jgi:hypothetical protein
VNGLKKCDKKTAYLVLAGCLICFTIFCACTTRVAAQTVTKTASLGSGSHFYSVIGAGSSVTFRIHYYTTSDANTCTRLLVKSFDSSGVQIGSSSSTSDCYLPEYCGSTTSTLTSGNTYYVEINFVKGFSSVDYTFTIEGPITSAEDLGSTAPAALGRAPAAGDAMSLAWLIPVNVLAIAVVVVLVKKRLARDNII